ncbi:MAG: rhodanese-related sulfurtransferase [Bacteroidales bacterium]|nr:rhodanese-related sulfurtransferase [Bacteroidales bacterium]MCF8455248.1 rhodanese-related sulfurtransferase [Bacteroidales bacterium]
MVKEKNKEFLYNTIDKRVLKEQLMAEDFKRITLSFYRYVILDNPVEFRDNLYRALAALNAFGRIYVAREGINAQMSVPEAKWTEFKTMLDSFSELKNMPLKIAVEDDGKSFYVLKIKVRHKILADGLEDGSYDVTNVGNHLSAEGFNQALENPETIVVDMRNHYESEIGRFENAICPDVDTFREEVELVVNTLQDKKDKKVLLYCTGGIRCEKASAYLKHHGFRDVNQLHGGVIEYARQVKLAGLESKFKGKNFVFDERLGERITDDVLATCHQCGKPADSHTNCANNDCHLLFIQCTECAKEMEGCCSADCRDFIHLPVEEQDKIRKAQSNHAVKGKFKSRLRPDLKKLRKVGFASCGM